MKILMLFAKSALPALRVAAAAEKHKCVFTPALSVTLPPPNRVKWWATIVTNNGSMTNDELQFPQSHPILSQPQCQPSWLHSFTPPQILGERQSDNRSRCNIFSLLIENVTKMSLSPHVAEMEIYSLFICTFLMPVIQIQCVSFMWCWCLFLLRVVSDSVSILCQ